MTALLVVWVIVSSSWFPCAQTAQSSPPLHPQALAAIATPAQLAGMVTVEFSGEVRQRDRLTDSIRVHDATLFFVLPDGFMRRWTPRAPLVGQTRPTGAVTFGFSGDRRITKAEPPTGGLQFKTLSKAEEREQLAKWKLYATALLVGLLLSDPTPIAVTYAAVGTAESKDGEADVLEARCESGATFRLFLNRQTHRVLLLTTSTRVLTTASEGPGEERWYFSEHRRLGGLTVPTLIVIESGGRPAAEWQFNAVRINPPLPAELQKTPSAR